eukprot:c45677_g1_i1.p1 GENE.c45677_g1_i1~~c45677_g1_i1.p1  ORF type:complete len:644 (-),score=146.19 c45677_g1_i1:79-2010(-)
MPAVLSTPLSQALRPHLVPLSMCGLFVTWYYNKKRTVLKSLRRSESKRSLADLQAAARNQPKSKPKISFQDLYAVLKIAFGKRELFNLFILTVFLLFRTVLTLWVASSFGTVMKLLCRKDWRKLSFRIQTFASWSVLCAIVNGALKYLQFLLEANIRQRLTSTAHKKYMERMNYYITNKVGTDKFENADQLITDNINAFSETLSDCYSNMVKPGMDLVMFTYDTARAMGIQGPVGMYTWFGIAAYISALVMPPYGRLSAEEQVLEGRFRTAHANLINNSEMVAFSGGERPEKEVLDRAFDAIRKHGMSVHEMKLPCDVIQGYVNKYLASCVGFLLLIRPVVLNHNNMGSLSAAEIAKYFVERRQVLEGLANSVLAFFELQKKLGSLQGLSMRLRMLFDGLERREPILQAEKQRYEETNPPRFVSGTTLRFEHVSVYRPDGKLLIHDLTMEVKAGERVMITGDNGCGKSSLFRVLCQLWPLVCGTITRPANRDILFLSQVNFVPIGTLRDIVVYPESKAEMKARGKTDEDVRRGLSLANLADLRIDGVAPKLDDQREWETDLSPGQKQRMAFARLFYHCPKYAILDECTNGVAPKVEEDLYNRCRELGMAIFSISHKEALKALHDRELHINDDGKGGYTLRDLK